MKISAPYRVRHTYRQHIVAPPATVFPLLCPVRESDWVQGWDPVLVVSESGLAEDDCVFVTSDRGREATWIVTRFEPASWTIELIKVTPGVTVGHIRVVLAAEGSGTAAEVTYQHTALSDAGREFVDRFDEEFYVAFMKEWESSMNHYLTTGEMRRVEE
ncbi:MAG: hypothetical protein HYU52_07065 [Acidobacteria bacterium]|nr:hypothetical protein [Acidobacteriota bacterium]